MSEAAQLGLGRTIAHAEPVVRDAIHIAVVPVYASEHLAPGTKVRLAGRQVDDVHIVEASNSRPYVGVIDPFLQRPARKGEKCWLFLNPGSIRSLRHEWSHPAFDKETS